MNRLIILILILLVCFISACIPKPVQYTDLESRVVDVVGMCGELAGMTKAIPILLGLGLDEFSMNPRAIPEAKNLISKMTDETSREIVSHAMSFGTAVEIENYMKGILASL